MAAGDANDLMMMFVLEGQSLVPGEARTSLDSLNKDNVLTRGFKKGFFIEVDDFSMKTGTSGNEQEEQPPPVNSTIVHVKSGNKPPREPRRPSYKSFREGKFFQYPVDLSPVRFSRSIDIGSPVLMQRMIHRKSLERVTIIKRKATGTGAAGEVFLRLDFKGVLLINIDWSEDDEVKEDVEFIARSVTINYRPQLPDGSLGASIQAFWSMVPNDQPFNPRSA